MRGWRFCNGVLGDRCSGMGDGPRSSLVMSSRAKTVAPAFRVFRVFRGSTACPESGLSLIGWEVFGDGGRAGYIAAGGLARHGRLGAFSVFRVFRGRYVYRS